MPKLIRARWCVSAEIAERKEKEMNNMASALGVGRDSRPGDSFNAEIQAERIGREKIQREIDKKERHVSSHRIRRNRCL